MSQAFQFEHNGEFYRLRFAVLHEPEKVAAIVAENRAILEETNFTGETVLRWLAVENHTEGVRLLRSLGASIPLSALIEAAQLGHIETVSALLELGADPEGYPADRMLRPVLGRISKRQQQIIRSCFRQFGHAIEDFDGLWKPPRRRRDLRRARLRTSSLRDRQTVCASPTARGPRSRRCRAIEIVRTVLR